MKRSLVLLVLVIAVAATLMSGCATKRPVTMTMTAPADKVCAAAVGKDASLQFDLVLKNIHVYPEDGGTTGAVVMANEVKLDLIDILAGKEVKVLATELKEGTYYDLTMTFSEVYAKGSLDVFGLIIAADVDVQLNNGKGITVKYPNTKLVVDKDGAELVWTCDVSVLLTVNGSTTEIGAGAQGSIAIN